MNEQLQQLIKETTAPVVKEEINEDPTFKPSLLSEEEALKRFFNSDIVVTTPTKSNGQFLLIIVLTILIAVVSFLIGHFYGTQFFNLLK